MQLTLVRQETGVLDNPIKTLIDLQTQIKKLQAMEKSLKEQIALMCDEQKTDVLRVGGFTAERKLTVANILDTARARELLGDAAPMKEQERISWKYV